MIAELDEARWKVQKVKQRAIQEIADHSRIGKIISYRHDTERFFFYFYLIIYQVI